MKEEEILKEFDKRLGSIPEEIIEKTEEATKDQFCFICGQPYNKNKQVLELRAFIKKSMASIREETMKELPEYHSIKNRADAEDYWTGYNHAIAIMQTKINKSIINNIRE